MRDCPNTRRHLILGGNVKRIIKAALGGLAGGALILGGTVAANGESIVSRQTFSGELTDLNTATADGPFDSADATVKITETPDGTYFWIRVKGIDPEAAGQEFGAHLHLGPCVEGNGGAAGDHYNTDVLPGGLLYADAVKSPETEVWLDLVPNEEGVAVDQTLVPFVPVDADGVMSIVIHFEPTNDETGKAGAREACLPLSVSSWKL
jgi:Cu-Zn family superoxide dismutase